MHAYLIVGTNQKKKEDETNRLVKLSKSAKFEANFAKIQDVKDLNRYLKLAINKPTAVILNNVDRSSTEAQNAFLKNLEEPQRNILFILLADTLYSIPPTIKSRCQVIRVADNFEIEDDKTEKAKKFIDGNTGQRMMIIKDIYSRPKAVEFMKSILIIYHQRIQGVNGEKKRLADKIESAIKTLNALDMNGNVQLQLSNFVVNLDN